MGSSHPLLLDAYHIMDDFTPVLYHITNEILLRGVEVWSSIIPIISLLYFEHQYCHDTEVTSTKTSLTRST